ncbi:hypothetical protein [Lactiplantibacillus carotarum]|uniref:hypothetical protein n=1 Tax=Lactiplantibacillus carotarum TaxID=2993456 RepID=UPI00298ED360|nr:hypothetical protein [Lactiplantibacillus carotarum]
MVSAFSLTHFLTTLAEVPDSFYYVLYEIIGFFISLPVLRVIAVHAQRIEIHYLFWIQFIFMGAIPIIMFYTGISTIHLSTPVAITNEFFYALMGYWLSNRDFIWRITREQLMIMWLLSFCCYAIMVSTTMYQANVLNNYEVIGGLNFSQTLQVIPTLTVWITIATWVLNRPKLHVPKSINFVTNCYALILVAGILLSPLQVISTILKQIIGIWWSGLIWVLITLVISYFIIAVLRRLTFFSEFWPNLFYNDVDQGVVDNVETNTMD